MFIKIYKTLSLTTENTIFSGTHDTFTEINHVTGHKANLKYHRNKTIYIFSPKESKIRAHLQKDNPQILCSWKLKNPFLSNSYPPQTTMNIRVLE